MRASSGKDASGGNPPGPAPGPQAPRKPDEPRSRILDASIEREFHDHIDMKLDDGVELDQLMTPANVAANAPAGRELEEIMRVVNAGRKPSASSSVLGKLIEPGKIGLLDANGRVEVVGPGRWLMPNPRVTLAAVAALTENPIRYETLSIVRVGRGQVGLALMAGQPLLLGEGLHMANSRLWQFLRFESVAQEHIHHLSIHVIRVPKGAFAKVIENNIPKLLPEGVHAINSAVFEFRGIVTANQDYIQHGTIHVVRVAKGHVACVFDNNQPVLLPEGTHRINSNTFNFVKMENLAQQVIRHGTITRFRVRHGEVGLAWDENQPTFFEEGEYEKNSPGFAFEKAVSTAEKRIMLGSRKIITVYDGEIGVSYDSGKLRVLGPARHVIASQSHIFEGFLSTQQQCLSLATPNKEKGKEDVLVCETKDFVEIGIKADVFYKVVDPEKALLVVGIGRIDSLVRETSTATLNSIIRSTSLAEVAQSSAFDPPSEKEHAAKATGPSAPLFFDKVHDEFISKLRDQFLDQYGIDIRNIRIESFKIIDHSLADSISKQAFTTSQTQTQLANLAGQTEIATAQQQRDSNLARIKAEGDAMKLRTETDARNRATMDTARAEADAMLLRAEAEAKALEMKAAAEARSLELKAQAEANAIIAKGKAEQERAQMLSDTPLANQLALIEAQGTVLKNTFGGVQKMMFLPPEAASNPMSFFSLAQQQAAQGFMANK